MVQWVKGPALSLQGCGSLPWRRFGPQTGNFHMLLVRPKKKKGKKMGNEKALLLSPYTKRSQMEKDPLQLTTRRLRGCGIPSRAVSMSWGSARSAPGRK